MADRQRLPLARATVTRSVQPAPHGSEVTLEVRFTGIFGRLWWRVVGVRVTSGLSAQARGLVAAAERA